MYVIKNQKESSHRNSLQRNSFTSSEPHQFCKDLKCWFIPLESVLRTSRPNELIPVPWSWFVLDNPKDDEMEAETWLSIKASLSFPFRLGRLRLRVDWANGDRAEIKEVKDERVEDEEEEEDEDWWLLNWDWFELVGRLGIGIGIGIGFQLKGEDSIQIRSNREWERERERKRKEEGEDAIGR